MEAKSRLNDDGTPIINCGQFEYSCGTLWNGRNRMQFCESDLDALYAVLHARALSQQYDKSILQRIGKAVRG
jgi:hypothetical protein